MKMPARHGRRRRSRMRPRFLRFRPSRWLPEETRLHLRNASREELLAMRSLLDAAISRLEHRDGPPRRRSS